MGKNHRGIAPRAQPRVALCRRLGLVVMLAINSLTLGGTTTELSVTDSSRYSAVMEGTCAPKFQSAVQYGSHSETK